MPTSIVHSFCFGCSCAQSKARYCRASAASGDVRSLLSDAAPAPAEAIAAVEFALGQAASAAAQGQAASAAAQSAGAPPSTDVALGRVSLFSERLDHQFVTRHQEQAAIEQAKAASLADAADLKAFTEAQFARVQTSANALGFSCVDAPRNGLCFAYALEPQLPPSHRTMWEMIGDELLLRVGHWQPFTSEVWTAPQFRNAVQQFAAAPNYKSPIMPLFVAAAANAFEAVLVLVCSVEPYIRVLPPTHRGIKRVIWLGYEDNLRAPHFFRLQPQAPALSSSPPCCSSCNLGCRRCASRASVCLHVLHSV